jgi:hypothetical protein
VRGLKNFSAEQPHTHAVHYELACLSEKSWINSDLQDATKGKISPPIPSDGFFTLLSGMFRLDGGETGGVHSAVDVYVARRVFGARQHGQGERFEPGQFGGEKTGWKHSAPAATTLASIQGYAP